MSIKSISRDEVLHLAKLASLTLNEAEIEKLTSQFGQTLDYIQNLDELDTSQTQPTNSVVDLSNVTFEDGTQNARKFTKEQVFKNTKKAKKDGFAVERIM